MGVITYSLLFTAVEPVNGQPFKERLNPLAINLPEGSVYRYFNLYKAIDLTRGGDISFQPNQLFGNGFQENNNLIASTANQLNSSFDNASNPQDLKETNVRSPEETLVLVAEVVIENKLGGTLSQELIDIAYDAIQIRPGGTSTRSQLQEDISSIFATGYFADVQARPEDTDVGVRVTFSIKPNPILTRVDTQTDSGRTSVLSENKVDEIFGEQYGSILNLIDFQDGVLEIKEWYRSQGYVLANVTSAPQISDEGVATLVITEGVIESIEVRYIDSDGNNLDEEGETQPFIIFREFESQLGNIFQQDRIQEALEKVSDLNIFSDIRLSLDPGDKDPRKFKAVFNVTEGNTGVVNVAVEFNFDNEISSSVSYTEENYAGRAQKISISTNFGQESGLITQFYINSAGARSYNQLDNLAVEGITALNTAANVKDGYPLAISSLLRVIEVAKKENRKVEAALSLVNLGNLYGKIKKYDAAISVYQQAQNYFNTLEAPGLELLMQLRIANLSRTQGQPDITIAEYYNALNMALELEDKKQATDFLGYEAIKILEDEWHIDQESQISESFSTIIPFVKSTILLDIASTYSAMGDYQQALYIVQSPQLLDNTRLLSRKLGRNINDLISNISENAKTNTNSEKQETESQELTELFSEVGQDLENEARSLIKDSSEIFKALGFQIIFSDLDDPIASSFYKEEYEKTFDDFKQTTYIGFDTLALYLQENIQISISDDFSAELFSKGFSLMRRWFSRVFFVKSEVGEETSEIQNLQKESIVFVDQLEKYFRSSEIIEFDNETSGLISELNEIFLPAIKKWISNPEYSLEVSEDIENILLNKWPSHNNILQEYNWIRGYFLQFIGAKAYEQGDYQKAADIYVHALPLLSEADDFLDSLFKGDDLEKFDGFIDEQVDEFKDFFKRENAGALGETLTSVMEQYSIFIRRGSKNVILSTKLQAANSYVELGEALKAKILFNEVLTLAEEISEDDATSLATLGISNRLLSKEEVSEIYYGIARADFALGNLDDSQKAIEKAISINETFIPADFLSEKSAFTQSYFQYGYGYPNRGSLSFSLSTTAINPWIRPQDEETLENFQNINAARRSSETPKSFFSRGTVSIESPPCVSIKEYFECRQKYFELYIGLLQEKNRKFPGKGFNILAFEQSERARTRSLEILHNLNNRIDNYDQLSSNDKRLLVQKILFSQSYSFNEIYQNNLDSETLLIEYFLGDEKSYMWVVSQEGNLQTFELPPRSIIESKAKEFYDLLTAPVGRVQPQTTAKVGDELSNIILGPIKDQLNHQRLLIVADGVLQYLPFNILSNPSPDTSLENTIVGEFAKYHSPLILEHEIVSLPSASSLVALRAVRDDAETPTKELALIADPVFSHKDERFTDLKIGHGNFESFETKDLEPVDILYGALPNTLNELSKIKEFETLLPTSQFKNFVGFDASIENVLSPQLGAHRIVHIASHGIFNTSAPQRSGMVLSAFNQQGEIQPGLLSPAYAFNNMDLSATELVFLSGCRTGLNEGYITREGITGFTGGLMSAGADRVIASLWSVEDEATRELVGRFYTNLLGGDNGTEITPSQALRAAQIDMWNDPRWQTPYNWAAFIIQGEWQ